MPWLTTERKKLTFKVESSQSWPGSDLSDPSFHCNQVDSLTGGTPFQNKPLLTARGEGVHGYTSLATQPKRWGLPKQAPRNPGTSRVAGSGAVPRGRVTPGWSLNNVVPTCPTQLLIHKRSDDGLSPGAGTTKTDAAQPASIFHTHNTTTALDEPGTPRAMDRPETRKQ